MPDDTSDIISEASLPHEPPHELALPDNLFLLDPEDRALLQKESRRSKFTKRRALTVLLLLTILSVPLLILAEGLSGLIAEMQLAGASATAKGRVVDLRTNSSGGRGQTLLYYVSYRFYAPNQSAEFTNEQFVAKRTYDLLAEGDSVDVNYVPTNPNVSRLAGQQIDNALHDNRIMLTWIGAIGTLLASGFVIVQLMSLAEDYRIQRSGQLLIGHINHCTGKLQVTGSSMDSNEYGAALRGNFVIEVYYRFRNNGNHEIRQHEVRKRNDLLKVPLPLPDTPIAVLYLDDKHYKAL